jgi:hypothetical protein
MLASSCSLAPDARNHRACRSPFRQDARVFLSWLVLLSTKDGYRCQAVLVLLGSLRGLMLASSLSINLSSSSELDHERCSHATSAVSAGLVDTVWTHRSPGMDGEALNHPSDGADTPTLPLVSHHHAGQQAATAASAAREPLLARRDRAAPPPAPAARRKKMRGWSRDASQELLNPSPVYPR